MTKKSDTYKLGIFIQSRMGSKRFPGKSLSKINNKSLLEYILESLLKYYSPSQIHVLTSVNKGNEEIVSVAKNLGVKYFRGDEDNVASRFKHILETDEEYSHFFRICGDTPFFLPSLVTRADELAQKNTAINFISSKPAKSHPQGQNIELFEKMFFLEHYNNFSRDSDYEHVTKFFYERLDQFNYIALSSNIPYFDYDRTNFSVDTPANLEMMTKLFQSMTKPHYLYNLQELYDLYVTINS